MKPKAPLIIVGSSLAVLLLASISYQAHLKSLVQQRMEYEKYILSLQASSIHWIETKTPTEAKKEIQDYGALRLRHIKEGKPPSIEGVTFPENFIAQMELVFEKS